MCISQRQVCDGQKNCAGGQDENPASCGKSVYECIFHAHSNMLYITRISGADPGFWERGGLLNIFTTGGGHGRGRAPSRDRKGVLGER